MKTLLVLFLGIFIASPSFAAGPSNGNGFMGALALSAGLGETKDDLGSIPKTDMAYTEATLQLGYRFGFVAPLLQLGYRYIGQRTDPDKVNGNNLGGMGYTAGLGLEFKFSPIRVVGVMDLEGQYDLAKKSGGGSKVSYGKVSGFHALIGYNWRPAWEVSLNMSQLEYKQKTTGSAKSDIKSNPLTQTLYGVGVSYLF